MMTNGQEIKLRDDDMGPKAVSDLQRFKFKLEQCYIVFCLQTSLPHLNYYLYLMV